MARGRPKNTDPGSITLEEFQVQIALGVLTKPSQMTPFIRKTTNIPLIKWALYNKQKSLQKAAIHNPLCPVIELMYAVMFLGKSPKVSRYGYRRYTTETSCAELALAALHKKSKSELNNVFSMIKEYPQLSLFMRK